MKYKARPVIVNAYAIVNCSGVHPDGSMRIILSNLLTVTATPEMLARIHPVPGDFWVCQQDGYEYLNPQAVFLSKYEPLDAVSLPQSDIAGAR